MKRRGTDGSVHQRLVEVIHDVRRRWRLKIALRAAAALAVVVLVGFVLGSYALRLAGASPGWVLAVRVGIGLVALGVTGWLLFLPLARRVTDEQVALYLEEHEPSLRSALISALAADAAPPEGVSPALARRTIETALARCAAVENGRRIEQRSLQRSSAVLGGAAVMGLLLFAVGPGFVRTGARTLFQPAASTLPAGVFAVRVQPGDTSIARGADLPVTAALAGFRSETVDLLVRQEGDSVFQRIAMLKQPDGSGYQLRLFDLARGAEYQVEAGAVRSELYHVKVLEVPYVDRLQLTLAFPGYTGLPSVTMDDGGDVAAPAGTLVQVRVTPTMRVPGGRLVLDDGRTVTLKPDTGSTLTGEFRVAKSGLYHVELQPPTGKAVNGSPQYLIEVIDDRPPTVSLSKPGRDTRVTSVDEVFIEAKAEDDFGVKGLDLVYSVNGAPEKTVPLLDGGKLREVTAGHTVYLEEMGLKPGDFISYYARASDVGPGARKPVSSDIYFLEVRPYDRNYRQGDEAGGGGGGGGGGGQQGNQDDQLSRRQRELIAATFNVVRDQGTTERNDFTANVASLAEAQAKLKEQAETLVQRLTNRGAVRDSTFLTIIRSLPLAAAEMDQAVAQLRSGKPSDALPPEQRALLHLQRAEAAYRDVQVSMGQQQGGGGGGGGGGGASPEDLAELFGLELDKLRNQYETVQRGEQEQTQGEVQNTVDRVKELARRQQQANDQLRATSDQIRNGGGADQQRQLAAETEEQARQLERLSREQSRPDLADAARRLREAADAMRRAAANARTGNASDSRAALERLRQAASGLEGSRSAGARQQADDIAQRARRLANEQKEIGRQMESLSSATDRDSRARRLAQQKEQQGREVADLESSLDRLAAQSRQEQPDASRRAQAAAESIRRNQLREMIEASRAGTQPGAPQDYVRGMEAEIGESLDELSRRTDETRQAMGAQSGRPGSSPALDRARDLARSLETMAERTRQAGDDPAAQGQQPGQREGQQAQGQQAQGQQQGQGQGQQGRRLAQNGQQQGRSQQEQGQQGQQGQGQQGQGQQGLQGQGQQGRGQQGQGQQGQGPGQRGQGQQPGQGQQGGTRSGQRGGNQLGGPRVGPGGVAGWGDRGPLDYNDIRQLQGEAQQRLAEARELRRALAAEGQDVRELDRAIQDMTRLTREGPYASWDELQKIQSSIVDRVKRIEFDLRKKAGEEESRKLFLAGSGEVPEGYRALVEKYYRELAEKGER